MTNLKSIILFGSAVILISSCASSYKNISPNSLNYGSTNSDSEVSLAYQTNVLSSSGNRKLAKKESRSYVKVVAVRIKNNSDETVIFGQDVALKSGGTSLSTLTPQQISSEIKQNSASYLLFLLLTPMTLEVGNDDTGEIDSYNIGYAVGPGLALLNMGIAAGANSSFRAELETYNMMNREIGPGETVYGLVGLSNFSFGNIELVDIRD